MTVREWVVQTSRKYIRFRMRSGRGATFTAELTAILDNATRAGAVTILLKTYLNVLLPWWSFPALYIIQKVIEYNIGAWDEKHGTWKYENGYNANLNPWNDEVLKKLQAIEQNMDISKSSSAMYGTSEAYRKNYDNIYMSKTTISIEDPTQEQIDAILSVHPTATIVTEPVVEPTPEVIVDTPVSSSSSEPLVAPGETTVQV